jgi:hypothetical protein
MMEIVFTEDCCTAAISGVKGIAKTPAAVPVIVLIAFLLV